MLFSPATSNRPNEFAFGSSQKCLREMASEDCGLVCMICEGGGTDSIQGHHIFVDPNRNCVDGN